MKPIIVKSGGCRASGLDVIRCFAILFVIGSHFFMYSGFNETDFSSIPMFILGMLQTLTMANVPLFLMLTGYLNLNKTISKKYYRGGIRVITSYLLISIITVFFRKYFMHEDLSWLQGILKILDFSAIPYAWYIEMWIGLFLLTPFLNILWKNIDSRRNKHILLITMYLLTAFPDCFNRYGFSLVPGYWELLYPMAFFFAGAYAREYEPQIAVNKLIAICLGVCLINPTINILIFSHRPMLHLIGDGNGIFVMPMTVFFFLLFYRINIKSEWLKKAFAWISVLSLDIYLFSWIFDQVVYPGLKGIKPTMQSPLILAYYIAAVGSVFLLSLAAASIKKGTFSLFDISRHTNGKVLQH